MEKIINNNVTLAGRLAADATLSANGKAAQFVVLRNQGKGNDPVSVRFTAFNKWHGRDVEIPVEKLKKGAAVRVNAYLAADNYVNQETGEKHYGTSFIVKNIEFLAKEAEAEADATDSPEE